MTASKQEGSNDQQGTRERLQEAWQSTLGRFATAEEGSRNLVHRLVEWGKLTGEEGNRLLSDWRLAIDRNRKELESRVETAVQQSVARLHVPTQEDVASVTKQLTALEERVAQLLKRRNQH